MKLDIIFWLAIAAIYILQSLAAKRKQQAELPPPEYPEERDPWEMEEEPLPDDLQTALGEIGRILRGEEPPPQNPAPSRTSPSTVHQQRLERPLPSRTEELQGSVSRIPPPKSPPRIPKGPLPSLANSPVVKGAESGVFYDEAFEKRGMDTFRSPIITHDHQYSFQSPAKAANGDEAVINVPDLSDPEALKRAFVTSEILSPPVSRRRR